MKKNDVKTVKVTYLSHSKKGVYCPQAGKHKLCYETEKKAQKAIRFNKDRTERYYWCQSCCSYHTTSKPAYVTSA